MTTVAVTVIVRLTGLLDNRSKQPFVRGIMNNNILVDTLSFYLLSFCEKNTC